MTRTLVLSLITGALAMTVAFGSDDSKKDPPPTTPKTEDVKITSISDRELSLYPGSLFAVPNPEGFTWNASSPGENERLPRAYPIAPPRIPHGIADFLPITLTSNGCLDCHAKDAGADAPELPPSHCTDLRNTPNVVATAVTGARYLCISCHVPTSDAQPARTSRLP